MKPKPRLRPLAGSFMMTASVMVPQMEKAGGKEVEVSSEHACM